MNGEILWQNKQPSRKDFIYPIPVQVKELLIELKSICVVNSEFIFHSAQNKPEKHLSRASVRSYLVDVLKYKGEMTLHGFRATFSTIALYFSDLLKYI